MYAKAAYDCGIKNHQRKIIFKEKKHESGKGSSLKSIVKVCFSTQQGG